MSDLTTNGCIEVVDHLRELARRNEISGVNGMVVFDRQTQEFYMYADGEWLEGGSTPTQWTPGEEAMRDGADS